MYVVQSIIENPVINNNHRYETTRHGQINISHKIQFICMKKYKYLCSPYFFFLFDKFKKDF